MGRKRFAASDRYGTYMLATQKVFFSYDRRRRSRSDQMTCATSVSRWRAEKLPASHVDQRPTKVWRV